MRVLPALLPFHQGVSSKLNRLPAGLPVKVVVEQELAVAPRTVKEFAFFLIHDVAFEGEAAVSFFPRAPELRLFAKSENVIADNILAPIVLMEAAVLSAVNNVVLKQDLTAAFVRNRIHNRLSSFQFRLSSFVFSCPRQL